MQDAAHRAPLRVSSERRAEGENSRHAVTVAVAVLSKIADVRRDEDGQDLLEYRSAGGAHRRHRHRRRGRRRATPSTQFSGRRLPLPAVSSPAFVALVAGALVATVIDIRTRRIPNELTAAMAGVGVGTRGDRRERAAALGLASRASRSASR